MLELRLNHAYDLESGLFYHLIRAVHNVQNKELEVTHLKIDKQSIRSDL